MESIFSKNLKDVRLLLAQDGQEALEILEKELVDLLITDFNMPGMDGVSLVKRLRNMENDRHNNKAIPVILVSGNIRDAEDSAKEEGIHNQIKIFLVKPFSLEYFVDRVKYALGSGSPISSPLRRIDFVTGSPWLAGTKSPRGRINQIGRVQLSS